MVTLGRLGVVGWRRRRLAAPPARSWRRSSAAAAAGGLLGLLCLGPAITLLDPPSAVHAHQRLVSSAPADGARVPAPSRVRLVFSEPVLRRFVQVVVLAPDGAQVQKGTEVDGPTVTIRLTRLAATGRYSVQYRVASADGHPVTGTVRFTVTAVLAPTGTSTQRLSASLSAPPSGSAAGSPGAAAPTGEHDHVGQTSRAPVLLAALAAVLGAGAVGVLVDRARRRGASAGRARGDG